MSNRLVSICFLVGFIVLAFGSTDDTSSDYSSSPATVEEPKMEEKEPPPAPAPKKKPKKKKPKKPEAQDMR